MAPLTSRVISPRLRIRRDLVPLVRSRRTMTSVQRQRTLSRKLRTIDHSRQSRKMRRKTMCATRLPPLAVKLGAEPKRVIWDPKTQSYGLSVRQCIVASLAGIITRHCILSCRWVVDTSR